MDPDALIARIVGPIRFTVLGPGHPADDLLVEQCVDIVLAGTNTVAAERSGPPGGLNRR